MFMTVICLKARIGAAAKVNLGKALMAKERKGGKGGEMARVKRCKNKELLNGLDRWKWGSKQRWSVVIKDKVDKGNHKKINDNSLPTIESLF